MSANTGLSITPANIVSITINYKPNSVAGFPNVNNPSIFVTINTGQKINIGLAEILTYIKILELKAVINAVGEVVLAIQSTPDGEQYTTITIGQPVVPPPVTGTVNFKVDGVNFVLGNALTNIVNLTGAGVADRGIDNSPFIAAFSLPKYTDNFLTDYSITDDMGGMLIVAPTDSGATWSVSFIGFPNVNGSYNIGFTTQPLMKFVTSGLADLVNLYDLNTGAFLHAIVTPNNTFYAPISAFYGLKWNNDFTGSYDQAQYINGVVQPATVFLNSGMFDGIPVTDPAVNEIHLDKAVIGVENNSAGNLIAQEFFVSTEANRFYIEMLMPPHVSTDLVKTTATNPIYYNIIPSLTTGTYLLDLLDRLGNILETFMLVANGAQNSVSPALTSAQWETLRFYFVASGAGIPIQAAAGNTGTSAALCPATLVTYYTASGTLTTGDTVFTDAALTIPLAGNTFILSPDGNIYAIDNVTGVVGAASGNSCNIPITGKNLFVVGTASTHLAVDGVDQGAKIAGSNYNIVVKSDSIITNNSGAGRTFNFYVMPPFIGANLTAGSGSPVVVANGGTYTLPDVITNYNYLVIT